MANRIVEAGGCTFKWKIKNLSHCLWLNKGAFIVSPAFIADALQGTKWTLWLYPMGLSDERSISLYLYREADCSGPDIVEVKYQLALLDKDGLLFEEETESVSFGKDDYWGFEYFESRERIFITERESLLPEDTLTVQCTIWKTEEKPFKSKHLYAQTIFKENRKSLAWIIDRFSSRKFALRNKFRDGLIDIDLILNGGNDFEREIFIIMNSFDERTEYFSFETSIIDSDGEKESCGMKKYFADDLKKGVLSFMLNFPKKLIEDKTLYLQNDVLCLDCEFVFLTETVQYESFGKGISTELTNGTETKEKFQNTTVLTDDLKSMYNDGIFSDVELRTSTKTFPAHRNILSARSPVFRRMFSNDMKEKNSGHVDITDLEDDTVHKMLLYIYTDVLEDLQFESASKLFAAADKYDISSLKSKCSSFLKDNLCPITACDVLILADQHQDEDLKNAVQDYILGHEEVFSTQEWVYFMETNVKLAADIMYRKIKPGKIWPYNL